MNAKLNQRLDRIEGVIRQHASPEECESPGRYFDSWLAARGIDPGPNESRAETTARAMGISAWQLRDELLLAAHGARLSDAARADAEQRR
jgi:hypothetical protein